VAELELRRPGYGAVRWLEPVDLRGGLLDKVRVRVRARARARVRVRARVQGKGP